MRLASLAILILAIFPTETLGQTSRQYALMGRKVWAAFQCAALAHVAGNADEQRRLFSIGYEQGKAFVNAVQAGKIEHKDLKSEVPHIVLLLLEGPTVDFMLGRIFESAVEHATKEVFKNPTDELKVAIAKSDFAKKNCGLM